MKDMTQSEESRVLVPIRYSIGDSNTLATLEILNQTLLPQTFQYDVISTAADAYQAIKSMRVRGAPAIAIVAILGVAVEAARELRGSSQASTEIIRLLNNMCSSRPTAINLKNAVVEMIAVVESHQQRVTSGESKEDVVDVYLKACDEYCKKDGLDNEHIGHYGAEAILNLSQFVDRDWTKKALRVLTHCNTGSLATSRYGTALGVVRCLWFTHRVLGRCFCTETRPWNQGSRLTFTELTYEGIPGTLLVDSACASLMRDGSVDVVVVGADRVCRNGDVINKIGTYSLAVAARAHRIPFYVAAPWSSIDLSVPDGAHVPLEHRDTVEITHTGPEHARVRTVVEFPSDSSIASIWNPCFDITPSEFITGGIITEKGVFPACEIANHAA